ncbi:MAG TPA: LysM peptidoglycan-binding domain-containing protein [Anaerolineales bacterium]|nr:LysM peptidoglycan-binding domain-containing protein [Anaerolineales bacterium]
MSTKKSTKKWIQIFVLMAVVLSAFATTSSAFAAACGSSVTVLQGDTLRKIAERCGTTVSALRRANPEIGSGDLIFPNQVLQMPGTILGTDGGYFIYIVARGDTLKGLATRFSTTVDALLAANKNITNANVIYEGQRLTVYVSPSTPPPSTPPPASGQTYYVKKGDSLRKIAAKFNTTVEAILKVNTNITNPNVIYVGQAIKLPSGLSTYIVQKGDTLKSVASKYGTTVEKLLGLNPSIKNANLIYVGQVIYLW